MSNVPETRPIPSGRYAAPDPAPNKPTECERCGAPAISKRGVGKHDEFHREQDKLEKRQTKLLDRLEAFLDSIENLTTEDGTPQKFPDWKQEVDEILDSLPAAEVLEELAKIPEQIAELKREPAPAAAEPVEIIPWPGNPWSPEEDETVEPDEAEPAAIVGTGDDGSPLVDAYGRTPAELAADQALRSVPDLAAELEPDEDALAAHDDDLDDPLADAHPWGARR
jgi:hypothetical protein